MRSNQAQAVGSAGLAPLGKLLGSTAHELDAPLASVRSQVDHAARQLVDYRTLVKRYDAAVQYCLQPVELIFGADKASLDKLVLHVEGARRASVRGAHESREKLGAGRIAAPARDRGRKPARHRRADAEPVAVRRVQSGRRAAGRRQSQHRPCLAHRRAPLCAVASRSCATIASCPRSWRSRPARPGVSASDQQRERGDGRHRPAQRRHARGRQPWSRSISAIPAPAFPRICCR